MKIINKTKNNILAEEVIMADTVFKRIKGLLGRKEIKKGQALIIKPCNSIHTFFMRFSIDVIFVDKDNRIIETIISLKPFRLTRLYPRAAFVIELPAGVIQASLTQTGDILWFGEDK
ncbi:MAG: DUF192 domain-containing protein [Candidatus Omnitrophica bacterium]|nr:DUF192 domain-containing protein [Candidatus Omnitrophota bacterium]